MITIAITIKQIAEQAKVHRSTVDKVLHKRPGVSDEVRAKIQKIIDDSGYQVNPIGKALNSYKRATIIGVVLMNVDALFELREGIEQACQEYATFNLKAKYKVIDFPDVEGQYQAIKKFIAAKVSAIVVVPLDDPKISMIIDKAMEAGIPVITVNNDISTKRFCYVGQNHIKAGRVAGRMMSLYLGQAGYIGLVTGTSRSLMGLSQREHGFNAYIKDNAPDIEVVASINTMESPEIAYKSTRQMLEANRSIDGLFITCGCVPEICRAVHDAGRDGITVISYERYPQIEQMLQSGLVSCTITSDLKQQGYQAIKVLYERFVFDRMPEDNIYLDIGILIQENL